MKLKANVECFPLNNLNILMCTFLMSTELSKFYGFMDIFPFSFARCFCQLIENQLIYGLTMLPYKTSRSLLKPSSWKSAFPICNFCSRLTWWSRTNTSSRRQLNTSLVNWLIINVGIIILSHHQAMTRLAACTALVCRTLTSPPPQCTASSGASGCWATSPRCD